MRRPGIHNMFCGLLLISLTTFICPSLADAGPVLVTNKTDENVSILFTSWTDDDGVVHQPPKGTTWSLPKGQTDSFSWNNQTISGSEVHWTISTDHGSTSWNATQDPIDGLAAHDRNMLIDIIPEHLPKHVFGDLAIRNSTGQTLSLSLDWWITPDGKTQRAEEGTRWTMEPDAYQTMNYNNSPICGREIHYTLYTEHGSRSWKSSFIDENNYLSVTIAANELPPHIFGAVHVTNGSSQSIRFVIDSYTDKAGVPQALNKWWDMSPGESYFLSLSSESGRLVARDVNYRITNDSGSRNWSASTIDTGNNLSIVIHPFQIPGDPNPFVVLTIGLFLFIGIIWQRKTFAAHAHQKRLKIPAMFSAVVLLGTIGYGVIALSNGQQDYSVGDLFKWTFHALAFCACVVLKAWLGPLVLMASAAWIVHAYAEYGSLSLPGLLSGLAEWIFAAAPDWADALYTTASLTFAFVGSFSDTKSNAIESVS